MFVGSFLCGWVPSLCFGEISQKAGLFLLIPFPLVFMLGYGAWAARLQAIAFELLGRSLFKALFQLIVRRRKPDWQQVLPDRDKVMQLAVRAQKAAWSFLFVAIAIAVFAGAAAVFISSQLNFFLRPLAVAVPVVLWGWLLALLGRRGYLPLPEGGEGGE